MTTTSKSCRSVRQGALHSAGRFPASTQGAVAALVLAASFFLAVSTDANAQTFTLTQSATVDEGQAFMLEVTADGPLTGLAGESLVIDVLISLDTGSDTADADDFPASLGATHNGIVATVTFAGNEMTELTQSVMIPTLDDTVTEGEEQFGLRLSVSSEVVFTGLVTSLGGTSTMTIRPSDQPTTVAISVEGNGDVAEDRSIDFMATLSDSATLSNDVVVSWSISVPATATSGEASAADFQDTGGTVTIRAGQNSAAFTVRPVNDSLVEPDETFTVTLTGATQGVMPTSGMDSATGRILANDAAMVSISPVSAGNVAEGDSVTFTAALSGGATLPDDLQLTWSVPASGDGAVAADFTATGGPATIPAGQNSVTFTVETEDDSLPEEAETFTVTLQEPSGGFPTGVTAGTLVATGTIRASTVQIRVDDAEGSEPAGRIVFRVTLTGSPGTEVVLNYEAEDTSGNPAMVDEDFEFENELRTLTFSATATGGDLTQTVVVVVLDDDENEGDETFRLRVTPASMLPLGVTLERDPLTATGTILDDDGIARAEERLSRANTAVLPHVAQAMVSSILSAIGGRVDAAGSGERPSQAPNLAGTVNLLEALEARELRHDDEKPSVEQVLGGSSFALSLNAAEEGSLGNAGSFAMWGNGDYRDLSGPDSTMIDWDGDMFGFVLGADVRVRSDLLAGLSVSRYAGSFDYTDRTDPVVVGGDLESRMASVHPYVSWSPDGGSNLWATAGYGVGEVEIDEKDRDSHKSDTRLKLAAVGASHKLLSDDKVIPGGTATLRIKGQGSVARMEVEGKGRILPADYDVRNLRLALEGSYECHPGESGGCLSPLAEIGVRHDSGDARTGLGLELGGGLRFTNPAAGLTIEGRGRVLVADRDDHEDWGVGGQVVLDPGADSLGLSLRLAPSFGDATGRVDRLYDRHPADLTGSDVEAPSGRVDTEVGYGFASLSGEGVVTPYAGVSLSEADAGSYRVGGRLKVGQALNLSFEGNLQGRGAGSRASVVVRARLYW